MHRVICVKSHFLSDACNGKQKIVHDAKNVRKTMNQNAKFRNEIQCNQHKLVFLAISTLISTDLTRYTRHSCAECGEVLRILLGWLAKISEHFFISFARNSKWISCSLERRRHGKKQKLSRLLQTTVVLLSVMMGAVSVITKWWWLSPVWLTVFWDATDS